jgi:ribosomal protein S18 acetylase RimI-like enzyme
MAPDHLFLGTLCVTPEHQNRGIGAAVMRALAVQANHLPVHLSVLQANPAARRFYERLGCRWVSSTEYHDHLAWSDAAIGR